MSIVAIGKNSFLAQNLAQHPNAKDWKFLGRDEIASRKEIVQNARVLINFAFDPALTKEEYTASRDMDSILAGIISTDCHYIMLSSRMVYGEMEGDTTCFKETSLCRPTTLYGKNKKAIEERLASSLAPEKFTILRLSNIFGVEKGRKTFFGTAMKTLHAENLIKFDISSESIRDFLPAKNFSDALTRIAAQPKAGTYNLGSGVGVTCGDIAKWLIEGYGQGKAVFEGEDNRKGAFCLDMSKTLSDYSLPALTKEDIREATILCGKTLATH